MTQGAAQKLRVGIVGAGTIGKRLVDAVLAQPDMSLAGVAMRRDSAFAAARASSISLYNSGNSGAFGPLAFQGDLRALLNNCDVVADCGPRGTAAARKALYAEYGCPFVLQGGEPADDELSYCSAFGAERARGAQAARVVSCNTTALVRFVAALAPLAPIAHLRLVLARCATDPDKASKGEPMGLTADRGYSHHADDLRLFWPGLDVSSLGLKAPTNRGHMITGFLSFERHVSLSDIRDALRDAPRVQMADGTPETVDIRTRFGQGLRKDCHDLIAWSDALMLAKRELAFVLSVHMESIVIPDSIDALRLIGHPEQSLDDVTALTDAALGGADTPQMMQVS